MNTESLTTKQRIVFYFVVSGDSNAEIAAKLGTCDKTVKQHVTWIYRKTGCTSRARLIARYYMDKLNEQTKST